MKSIELSQGYFAIVDDDDYDSLVGMGKWSYGKSKRAKTGYAIRWDGRRNVGMHRIILQMRGIDLRGLLVDHKDGDGLNNRKQNLRACTRANNGQNARLSRANTTGFKGVSPERGQYLARIQHNAKGIRLGRFPTAEQAAYAYDDAARKLWGEFAYANFDDRRKANLPVDLDRRGKPSRT